MTDSTPSVTQAVSSLTLINADTNKPIPGYDPVRSGATLDLATLSTRNLSIRANTDPSTVGSVRFGLDGKGSYSTDNAAPYAIADDNSGDYAPWTPSVGGHSVTATPYTGSRASGTAGTPVTVAFTVSNSGGDGGTGGGTGGGGAAYDHDRIAVDVDGNFDDPDDWAATPVILASISRLKLQHQLVHYSYNNSLGAGANDTAMAGRCGRARSTAPTSSGSSARRFSIARPTRRRHRQLRAQIDASCARDRCT